MNASVSAASSSAGPSTRQRFFWSYPEWWSVTLCGTAWLGLLIHAFQHASAPGATPRSFGPELGTWLLMIAAMMVPLVLDGVRATAVGSLWARRHRAIGVFLLGYLAPWLAFGGLAIELERVTWLQSQLVPALGFALAALWQLTAAHKRAVGACHRRSPLAPLGWQADRDCLRFGLTIGLACVASCWPLMLACTFTGHGLVAMVGGLAVSAAERLSFRPRRRVAFWGTIAIGVYYLFTFQSAEWCGLG